MKNVMQRYMAIGLAVWVLCTSTGFSLYEHVCHFTGKVQLSAEKPDMCCPVPRSSSSTDQSFSKAACCDTHLTVIQLQAVSSPTLEKFQVPSPSIGDAILDGSFFFSNTARLDVLNSPFFPWVTHYFFSHVPLFIRLANLRL